MRTIMFLCPADKKNYNFKIINDEKKEVAIVKTGMMCFDYALRKTTAVPIFFKHKIDLNQV